MIWKKQPVGSQLSSLSSGKVNKTDIVNNLTTDDPSKVLSAAQGYALNSKLITSILDAGVINDYNDSFGTSSRITVAILPANSANTPWSNPTTTGCVFKFGKGYGRDLAISQEGIKTRSIINSVLGSWTDL